MGSNIEQCPFCGSAKIEFLASEVRIRCTRCGSCGPVSRNEAEAARRWNKPPREGEVVELPRDADGVPIGPGDVLYGIPGTAAEIFQDQKVICIKYDQRDKPCVYTDSEPRECLINQKLYTHTRPDSLGAVEKDLSRLVSSGYLDDPKGEARAIVGRIRLLREAGE